MSLWTPGRVVGLILLAGAVEIAVLETAAPTAAQAGFLADHSDGPVWSHVYDLQQDHLEEMGRASAVFALLGAIFVWLPRRR